MQWEMSTTAKTAKLLPIETFHVYGISVASENQLIKILQIWVGTFQRYASSFHFWFLFHVGCRCAKQEEKEGEKEEEGEEEYGEFRYVYCNSINNVTGKSCEQRFITKRHIAMHTNLILLLCTPVL